MELELTPQQPAEIAATIRDLVAAPAPAPDPWWRAGLDDALSDET